MAFGFMANTAAVTGLGTFYDVTKPIRLVGPSSVDANSSVMPQACYLSQIDLLFTVTSGIPECMKILLTWDSAGNDQLFRESESELLVAGVTTSTLNNAVVPIRTFIRAPATQTTLGEVYAWGKVDVGTVDLNTARLHWATRHWG